MKKMIVRPNYKPLEIDCCATCKHCFVAVDGCYECKKYFEVYNSDMGNGDFCEMKFLESCDPIYICDSFEKDK